MANAKDYMSHDHIAWCPGCGDFGILNAVRQALAKLDLKPKDTLIASGIGQAAKLPHYVKANCINGLHGRSLCYAAAAKIANKNLTVLVTTGEGDCYGEGGNHFIHNIRRNVDITVIVHNNQIYGLTKGQASPTTDQGSLTKIQPSGVLLEPFRALEVAIAMDAGFVARGYSADNEHLTGLIVEGIRHRGFSLIEVLQPCVTFNKQNTYEWYAKRVYKLSDDQTYDPKNKSTALEKGSEWGNKIPIGILYRHEKPSYEDLCHLHERTALVDENIDAIDITALFKEFA